MEQRLRTFFFLARMKRNSWHQLVPKLITRQIPADNPMLLVGEISFGRMDQRLARFILDGAEKRSGEFHPVNLGHEQIARHLGTACEVVSRLLNPFVEEGLIQLERRRKGPPQQPLTCPEFPVRGGSLLTAVQFILPDFLRFLFPRKLCGNRILTCI